MSILAIQIDDKFSPDIYNIHVYSTSITKIYQNVILWIWTGLTEFVKQTGFTKVFKYHSVAILTNIENVEELSPPSNTRNYYPRWGDVPFKELSKNKCVFFNKAWGFSKNIYIPYVYKGTRMSLFALNDVDIYFREN